MKTKNDAQETIDDQVRKMVLRGSAIILVLALITLTVNAQDFWKQFSKTGTYEKMAQLMVDQPSETERADAVFEVIAAEISIKLNHSSASFDSETEREEDMELESWMIDESNFISTNDFNAIETGPALIVESWMLDNKNFSGNVVQDETIENEPLQLEAWMIDNQYWDF